MKAAYASKQTPCPPLCPSTQRASFISAEAVRQNFDQAMQSSRFYHDAETKLNTISTIVGILATFASQNAGKFTIEMYSIKLNVLGFVIIAISMAALYSSIVYWLYHDLSWNIADEWRKLLVDPNITRGVYMRAQDRTYKEHQQFRKIFRARGYHYAWMAVQSVMCLIGVGILIRVV
jgi:hypothetical protein